MIRTLLEQHPAYREKLFIRGYLITENEYDLQDFPFYGHWNQQRLGRYSFYTHEKQTIYTCARGADTLVLIGACLNPFDGEYDEAQILRKLCEFPAEHQQEFIAYLNELTGNYLLCIVHDDGGLSFLTDPTGMLLSCYGTAEGQLFISSHPQLIADLCPLEKSAYIRRFEQYRWFYKYGVFFPGDLTQYTGIRRALQNHIIHYDGTAFSAERFYPCTALHETATEEEYQALVCQVRDILRSTLDLASRKWPDAAISMTGGMDSKTTVACANGLYDRFRFYSYVSMAGDRADAEAAARIAEAIGVAHRTYEISEQDADFADIEVVRAVLEHNNGGYRVNPNDVRKRAYFSEKQPFSLEVKSWDSEIARANYYKKFGLKRMPVHLTPRNMTAMFKVFTTQRGLAKATDQVFRSFIQTAHIHQLPEGYDESDLYLWEFRYSAWGGMVITAEHSYSNEIFIPFNNRRLLDLMLHAPKEKRISDEFHADIIKSGNAAIHKTGITVTNWNETRARMYMERAYFCLSSWFSWL